MAGKLPSPERPRNFLALRRGHSALEPACCRRPHRQQASRQERHGQLSREGQLLRGEVSFNYVVRSYVLPREFNEANQASSTCRLRLEPTVETSTPPFLGDGDDTSPSRGCKLRSPLWKSRQRPAELLASRGAKTTRARGAVGGKSPHRLCLEREIRIARVSR